MGTSAVEQGRGVTVDSSNNIYVTGYSDGAFDGEPHSGQNDILLVKFNSDGDKLWTKLWGTSTYEEGWHVEADSSNNIYLTGYSNGGLDGNSNSGEGDSILTKLNSDGDR